MKTYTVVYRMGGTENATWHRLLDPCKTEEEARLIAGGIETGGRKALIFITAQLDAIGMPEGWDAESPVRGSWSQYA